MVKQVHFSQARQRLSAIVDEVQKSGKPVTILRRGKPAAVVISHEDFQQQFGKSRNRKWRLAGSLRFRKGVDINRAIRRMRKGGLDAWQSNIEQLAKELGES